MLLDTVEGRRYAMEQAQASSRLEGHVHSPAQLEAAERYIRGEATVEHLIEESRRRALALNQSLTDQEKTAR